MRNRSCAMLTDETQGDRAPRSEAGQHFLTADGQVKRLPVRLRSRFLKRKGNASASGLHDFALRDKAGVLLTCSCLSSQIGSARLPTPSVSAALWSHSDFEIILERPEAIELPHPWRRSGSKTAEQEIKFQSVFSRLWPCRWPSLAGHAAAVPEVVDEG